MPKIQSEVFISYAWGGESEKIVNELEEVLKNKELTFIRDNRYLGFKGLITDFMKKIGTGKAVVIVISDKYLKSPYCMFELIEIYRNRDFIDRIFPIVNNDADIFEPIPRLGYLKYWREKKSELETAIQQFGADAITVVGDDYKIYHKVFNNFGEVVNVLKDINALTPEIHRESNFKLLYDALLKRLDEDSRFTRQNDTQKLLQQLSIGSRRYYEELTGNNGPYQHLDISEAILGGIIKPSEVKSFSSARLQSTVKDIAGEEYFLDSTLQILWQQEKRHFILLGDGGMGKTVSLIHLWKTLLNNNQESEVGTIPIFLTLHEYNTVSDQERDGFIAKRICWHYLGLKENRGATLDALWDAIKTTSEKEVPSMVLLLDGFNEVTVDDSEKSHLLLELQELRQKSNAAQILLTSRHEIKFTWLEGFPTLELQRLGQEKVKTYLQAHQVDYPDDQRLRQILENPMMLTLYANANEIVEQYKNDNQFEFKSRTTSQGELLWNYLEAQIVKLAKNYNTRASDFYYYKFMLRHFLPYVGYEMENARQFVFDENQFTGIVVEACRYFYRKEFIQSCPEYRSYLKYFDLKALDFADEAERFEKIRRALCGDLGLMKQENKRYEFLHQNFRDYFAAVHVLNELSQEVQNQNLSPILMSRPLPVYIRSVVGQITGEHYQTERLSLPTVLMQTLDSLRGIFDEEKIGYAVWNIVNIWKDNRQHLGGADFSQLNLLNSTFHDVICNHRDGNLYSSVKFDKSLLGENCFLSKGHNDYAECVAFHPDGHTFISGSKDNTIKAWDLQTGQCFATFQGHCNTVECVAFHSDGKTFISGSSDHTIKEWEFKTGICLRTFEGHNAVSCVSFHPKERIFISGSGGKVIEAWDLSTGKLLATYYGHTEIIRNVAFHPNGEIFISASEDSTIKAWDLKTGKCFASFRGHDNSVESVTFHPNGKTFLSGSRDNTIKAWDLKSGSCLWTLNGHTYPVKCVKFALKGEIFISCSEDNSIKKWDFETKTCLASFNGHIYSVNNVDISSDEKILISCSEDNTIKVWNLITAKCLATYKLHNSEITCIAIHPDGKTFVYGSKDNTIKVYELTSLQCLATFQGHVSSITSLAFDSKGKTFISGSWDYTVKAWDWSTGKCLASFEGHNNIISSVAFHPEGDIFISASVDNTIKLWNLNTGACLKTFRGHRDTYNSVMLFEDPPLFFDSSYFNNHQWRFKFKELEGLNNSINSLAFHPFREAFISASNDKTIIAWDLNTEQPLAIFEGHSDSVRSVAFHPDGKHFISGSADCTVKAWNYETPECLFTLKQHDSSVEKVAFHPRGDTFLSCSYDQTIKTWNYKTQLCLSTFKGRNVNVKGLSFHPDGERFISGSEVNKIRLWDLKEGGCLAKIINVSGLLIAGCSFMNLHPDSQLSPESKNLMRQYGAIFDEEDKQRWNEAVQRVFGDE